MKAIFVVMNSAFAVVKIGPDKKIQACTGFELCNTGNVLYQLSRQINQKLITMLISNNTWSDE